MSFIHVSGLSKSYVVGGTHLSVLKDLDLSLERGEMVAIVGASGVGKSTLLHVLGGLDPPDAGSIRIDQVELGRLPDEAVVAFRNQHVGFVFQFHHLLPEFSAVENAEMPLRIARKPRGRVPPARHRPSRARRPGRAPRAPPGHAVGRRAAARGDCPRPRDAADAPSGRRADRRSRRAHGRKPARSAKEMHREHGLTSVIATHNPKLAASCDRVLRLEEGRLRGV